MRSLLIVVVVVLQKEFQIYSDLRSPHVVLFFGACLRPELCMVFEFCARGTLFDVLNKDNSDEPLDWPRVLKLSMDIAKVQTKQKTNVQQKRKGTKKKS
jgi:serine/threonine protein kinase